MESSTPRKRVFAMASQGGHWVQLMRIVPAFGDRYELMFCSTKADYASVVGSDRFVVTKHYTRRTAWRMLPVFVSAYKTIRRFRPDVILTTGAAPAIAVILAGKLLGVKSIWIDSVANAEHLSLSGRIARRIATRVYSQWPNIAKNSGVRYAGNIFG
ncbi:MAG: oligosaccharide biosynthesis protein Alg14 [Muribaculaceae bacterium]|nr:oligosaccharide biosynthesis protein Alg14 [Muribaculaceae bacterium]MDE6321052.1 oligosaccharide biosynthesis protein Alg14 [Muribaculaceae bacterium]